MDAIEKIARVWWPSLWESAPERALLIDRANDLVRALNAFGFAIIDRKMRPSTLLTLGLLSGAGPQSREDYGEVLASIIGSQEVRPDAS